jgi:hypothetical protein
MAREGSGRGGCGYSGRSRVSEGWSGDEPTVVKIKVRYEIASRAGRARWSEARSVPGVVAKASRVAAFARVPVSSTSAPPRAPGASGRTSRPTQPTRVRCFPRRRRKRNETPSAGHTRVCLRPRPPPRALAFHAPHVAQHARREYACRLRALAMPRLRLGANSTNTVGTQQDLDFFFFSTRRRSRVRRLGADRTPCRAGWVRNDGFSSSRRRANTSTHERTT